MIEILHLCGESVRAREMVQSDAVHPFFIEQFREEAGEEAGAKTKN